MVLHLFAFFVLLLAASMTIRAMVMKAPTQPVPSATAAVDASSAGKVLSQAVQCRTVSHLDWNRTDWSQFEALLALLDASFPHYEQLRIKEEELGLYNRLYCIPGSDSTAQPALLLSHLDVVDVQVEKWSVPPYEGLIKDDFLWGRGSFDCKLQVVSILTAFEHLLKAGRRPKRTYYIAFGCDEETNGSEAGASRIAAWLEKQNLQFAYILDEGGVVSQNYLKGYPDIAVVGVAEKGYMDLSLTATAHAGHSSTPSFPTALGHLARAVNRIECHQMKVLHTPVFTTLIQALGESGSFGYRLLFLNLWITKPLLNFVFSKNPSLNGLIRTTLVPTMISASDKSNVIASTAQAIINVRLLPGQSEQEVLDFLRRTIADDRIEISVVRSTPPSVVSPVDCEHFEHLKRVIARVFPGSLSMPYMMMGATDSRKYSKLSKNIYRFTPARMDRSEVDRMHGVDERISLKNIENAVMFYTSLIEG